MADTVLDLQTNLAYRLGENAAPSDATTKAQRLKWLNEGYFKISRKRNWWWQEASDSTNTNNGTATYNEPANLKAFIELKINNVYYDQISYKDNRIYTNTLGVVQLPTIRRSYKFYRYNGTYTLIPVPGNDSVAHNIKYFKRATKLVNDSDTTLLPDEYTDMLPAYAEYKYWMSITQQAKSQLPKSEFDETFSEMMAEQGRRGWGYPVAVHDPDHQLDM